MERNFDIFISYRRNGGFEVAKQLFVLLKFDGYKVSFDIDTLRNGDFDSQLLNRIDECKDFILILNPGALDRAVDPNSEKSNDWVREELSYALSKDKNVIPIMLPGFTEFPKNLPPDIKKVERKNGPSYSIEYFDEFYSRLKNNFLVSSPYKEPGSFREPQEATIRINADRDCHVYRFNEYICSCTKGDFHPIKLKKGKHILRFVTSDSDLVEKEYIVEDTNFEDFIKVEFKRILTSGIAMVIDLKNGDYLYFFKDRMITLPKESCQILTRRINSMEDINNLFNQSGSATKIEFEDFVRKYAPHKSGQFITAYENYDDYCRIRAMGIGYTFDAMTMSLFFLTAQLNPEKDYKALLRYVCPEKQPKDLYLEAGDGIYEVKGPTNPDSSEYYERKNFIIKDESIFYKTILGGLLIKKGVWNGYIRDILLLEAFPYEITLEYEYKKVITVAPWTTIPVRFDNTFTVKNSEKLNLYVNHTFYEFNLKKEFSHNLKEVELELEIDSFENIRIDIKDKASSETKHWEPFK